MSPSNHRIQADQLSKTRRCSFFLEGRCKFTEGCTYAHSVDELRKAPEELRKTKMCDLFVNGMCQDSKCNFAHDYAEIRNRRDSRRMSKPSCDIGRQNMNNGADNETIALLRQIASLLQSRTAAPVTSSSQAPPGFEAPSILGYQTASLAGNSNETLADTLNRLALMSLSCTEDEGSADFGRRRHSLPTNPGFSLY